MATTTNLGLNKPARTDNINVVTAINNNMDVLDAAIGALPSGSNLQTEIIGKADKVASPTNGNFAALDSNGNLTDSGHKHSDYVVTVSLISGNKYRLTL